MFSVIFQHKVISRHLLSSILKFGKPFTHVIPTVSEAGITRMPAVLKGGGQVQKYSDSPSVYRWPTTCQVLFATHLIHAPVWGDIIHIAEITKSRLKKVFCTRSQGEYNCQTWSSQVSFWDTFFTWFLKIQGLCSSPNYGRPAFLDHTVVYKQIPVSTTCPWAY